MKRRKNERRVVTVISSCIVAVTALVALWSSYVHHEYNIHTSHPSEEYCRYIAVTEGSSPAPRVCAHGGDMEQQGGAVVQPNTVEAVERAIEVGSHCIEIDVSMTKDGELVALHDRDLAGLLSKKWARTGDFTLAELQEGFGVSGFRELLSFILEYDMDMIIDVKPPASPLLDGDYHRMARILAETVAEVDCHAPSCVVWCKDDVMLELIDKEVSQKNHSISFGIASMDASGLRDPFRHVRGMHSEISVVGMHHEYASKNPHVVATLKQQQRNVRLWTANTPTMMRDTLVLLPHVIVTSYPRKLLDLIESWRLQCSTTGSIITSREEI